MNKQDHAEQEERSIPVHLLSGFLGSGKTTLLNRVIDHYRLADVKAAVVMNEIGEVNLDGQVIGGDVPMAEMLSGCICCSMSGDLAVELKKLVDDHRPEVILIEATGAANPMEIIDAVTETSMYERIELRSIVTVVDGPELLARSRRGGRTYKLMQEQIRCATDLVVNKADRLEAEELIEVQQLVRELNAYAPLTVTTRCEADLSMFDAAGGWPAGRSHDGHICGASCAHEHRAVDKAILDASAGKAAHVHDEACGHDHGACRHGHEEEAHSERTEQHLHASHAHVMALTHYLEAAVDSHAFEAFVKGLPDNVYRAKGIVTLKETGSRFLFQFAYRELELIRITPQGDVKDVAVFIGEHFDKQAVLAGLAKV
ncbi:CobW family GTP-binding protein [Paenibacillus methanolicus]|uniref:G3E family GTPase n=1 Tax=Paenibacillus methanolicus TaxID=582686 RepID=A0A5S5BN98_9BACL|nr:CobW family GTP-binding protein [Paenibacillus methanolicus]TYP68665.1 G3E family GTPase [Paenibacillus methanolicus]